MGSQQQHTASERTKVNWSPSMERHFIDLMLDQIHRGNRSGHTFSKQAWTDMLTMFNAKFRCKFNRDTLKTHYSFLCKQYHDLKNLLDQDGFSWDDTCKMVVADARAWDDYIKGQRDVEIYRGKAIPNFSDLCLIYAYAKADGRYSRSSHDLDFDDDIQGLITGAGNSGISSLSMGYPEKEWATAMDQFFVELMLAQTKRGNKNDNTFNKKAWKEMIGLFNTEFCSHYNKGFLEHRYKELSKYYFDIQSLLKQKGFSWDKERQIIVAEDDAWDSYTKVYPDAQLYRNRMLLDYRDLRLIYGNLHNSGPRRHVKDDKTFDDVFLSGIKGKDQVGCFSVGSEILKVCWTQPMDRYLIDLLLDQALKGNQIGHKFTDEAWMEMTMMFTTQFGVFCDSGSLKQRFKFLRKQYSDIKILLGHSGFYWDDAREKVVAEDYAWDSYIKEHAEAAVYKNKSIPSFHKLCVIFGQGNSNRCSELGDANLESGEPDQMKGKLSESSPQSDHLSESDQWTPIMDRHFIDLMLQQVCQGNRVGSSFSDDAWTAMSLSFVDRFGLPHDTSLLKNRHKHFRRQYGDLKNMLSWRGFFWDEKWQMVTAYNNAWDAFVKEYPDARHYRGKRGPNYNDFCLIYGDSTSHVGPGYKNGYAQKTYWTPLMDRYFIDLMLEQVRQGNMIGQKFNKQAWDTMTVKFISQFGIQHDKSSLLSRYLILRKRFNDVKNLLDRPGFKWDEARQMVVANHHLWDSYIKEHPVARSYRNRSLPNFNDLFIIYGNPGNIMAGRNFDGGTNRSPTISDSREIKWTGTLQNYFIDLMLEQVRLGNNIGHKFSNRAWRWIIDAFKERFGLQFSKKFLESQHQRLMMKYRDITDLINQEGFEWDGFLQMAVANDEVWEAHIEEHPEAAKYRNRSLNTYEDLCMIYGGDFPVSIPEPEITGEDQSLASSDGIFGDLQCPGTDFEMPNLRKRRKSATFGSIWPYSRKSHKPQKSRDCDAIETVVDALRAIPEMNDELFLEACKFMEDERQAKKFVAMDLQSRSKWLRRKLRK